MPGAPLAIDLHDVSKTYRGKVQALRGISMQVRPGEVFGLLGPNGAGKSTLVKIIMTVVRPTHCTGTVLGRPVGHKPTLARVGYLPENHRFPRYLTGRQILHFFGALSGVPRRARHAKAGELLQVVGMTDAADRPVSTYSKGMAQRIGLAQALMNDPDLILLDEPTDGVDPVGRRDIRAVLGELRRRGKTIFINSHQLSELDALCDRVAILLAGQVIKQGTVHDLSAARQRYEIEVMPTTPEQDAAALQAAVPANWRGNGSPWTRVMPPVLHVGTADAAAVQPILDSLRQSGVVVTRVQSVRPSLEELFFDAVAPTAPMMPQPLPVTSPA
jgi:ABC-2 type transport system ATP-binding protein